MDLEGVQRQAMLEHFRSTMDMSCVYAMPFASASIAVVGEALGAKPAKRRRLDAAAVTSDVQEAADEPLVPEKVFFRVTTHRRLNLQRTVPLAAAVAERFDPYDVAITLHASVVTGHLEAHDGSVYCEPLCDPQQPCNPSAVLSFRGQSTDVLRDSFVGFRTGRLVDTVSAGRCCSGGVVRGGVEVKRDGQ